MPVGTHSLSVTDVNNCPVVKTGIVITESCPIDCKKYIDNCRTEWEDFITKNYASAKCKQWETACDFGSDIRRDGKVAIGWYLTSVPTGFNLGVQGTVLADITGLQKEDFDLAMEQIDLLLAFADKIDTLIKK